MRINELASKIRELPIPPDRWNNELHRERELAYRKATREHKELGLKLSQLICRRFRRALSARFSVYAGRNPGWTVESNYNKKTDNYESSPVLPSARLMVELPVSKNNGRTSRAKLSLHYTATTDTDVEVWCKKWIDWIKTMPEGLSAATDEGL